MRDGGRRTREACLIKVLNYHIAFVQYVKLLYASLFTLLLTAMYSEQKSQHVLWSQPYFSAGDSLSDTTCTQMSRNLSSISGGFKITHHIVHTMCYGIYMYMYTFDS